MYVCMHVCMCVYIHISLYKNNLYVYITHTCILAPSCSRSGPRSASAATKLTARFVAPKLGNLCYSTNSNNSNDSYSTNSNNSYSINSNYSYSIRESPGFDSGLAGRSFRLFGLLVHSGRHA